MRVRFKHFSRLRRAPGGVDDAQIVKYFPCSYQPGVRDQDVAVLRESMLEPQAVDSSSTCTGNLPGLLFRS